MGRLCALVPKAAGVAQASGAEAPATTRRQGSCVENLCSMSGPVRVEARVNLPTSLWLPSKPWRRPCSPSQIRTPCSTCEVVWVQVLAPGLRLTLQLPLSPGSRPAAPASSTNQEPRPLLQ